MRIQASEDSGMAVAMVKKSLNDPYGTTNDIQLVHPTYPRRVVIELG